MFSSYSWIIVITWCLSLNLSPPNFYTLLKTNLSKWLLSWYVIMNFYIVLPCFHVYTSSSLYWCGTYPFCRSTSKCSTGTTDRQKPLTDRQGSFGPRVRKPGPNLSCCMNLSNSLSFCLTFLICKTVIITPISQNNCKEQQMKSFNINKYSSQDDYLMILDHIEKLSWHPITS